MRSALSGFLFWLLMASVAAGQTAVFSVTHGGVGETPLPGSVSFDAAAGEYRVTGGGANIWAASDAFHFAYTRLSGDFTLTAEVRFLGEGGNAHRKAVLMVRQNLAAGSAYADVALHGDGLASLQYRLSEGGQTAEQRSAVNGPARVRLQRRGSQITALVAAAGGDWTAAGPVAVTLNDPVYAGLGVSSHDPARLETAVFSNVRLEQPPRYRSKVAIHDLRSRTSRTLYETEGVVEAPNWSRDGRWLLINTGGNLYRLPLDDPKPRAITLGGGEYRCNNDHDLSRDGRWLAFSASSPSSRQSQVYVAAADGSGVTLLTPLAPSYFHGWSPDGKWLAFVGQRNGKFELFRVARTGGEEQRLTSAGAYDDGPDYSPDGKWIYFNSNRKDGWNLWRMPAGGAGAGDRNAQQITGDAWEDWFPHPSPDGKRLVFLSFPPGTEGHGGRMPGVALRMMDPPGRRAAARPRIETLATFFGGQGSINVNSWAPDSQRFAYVVYELMP